MADKSDLHAAFQSRRRQLWLVGGALRDRLLGLKPEDDDYTTNAPPSEIEEIASEIGSRTVAVGKRFGTIAVEIGDSWAEITTFRGEDYSDGTRWPDVTFGASIEEDLARRDFTINAMAENTDSGVLLDPFGGVADLEAQLLRAVGNAGERFVEDPLRILRGARFVSQLGFAIENETMTAMGDAAGKLKELSVERVTAELDRLLAGAAPGQGLQVLAECEALREVLPELSVMQGCEQNSFHRFDVWEHTVSTVEAIEGEGDTLRLRRWGALMHDIGKPAVRHVKKNGEWGFYRHETVGADIAEKVLDRLHLPRDERRAIALMVRRHMDRPRPDDRRSVRRFMHRSEGLWQDLLALKAADGASHVEDDSVYQSALGNACRQIAENDGEALKAQSPLSGDELMELLGRKPGPWIRDLKDQLGEKVLDGDLAPGDREGATRLARSLLEERDP